jgi:hypothetical protein
MAEEALWRRAVVVNKAIDHASAHGLATSFYVLSQ